MKKALMKIAVTAGLSAVFSVHARPFFQARPDQPFHLSVGAVLFDSSGRIACHHFKHVLGHNDVYILMRETIENGETPLITLARGLQEEFGATGEPIAFLGCLSGEIPGSSFSFEKTTVYVACRLERWQPETRAHDDPEASSSILWLEPQELITLMVQQGIRFAHRIDADESEMIKRALPYIKQYTNNPAV